jgi:predicted aldo/keto reductase-like oxidoreductase
MIQRRRDAGQVRYIGFSAHNEDAALRLLDAFPFDSVLFPVNRVIWHAGNVGPRLLEAARSRGAEILALKALALRRWEEGEEHNWSKTWYKPADTFEQAELGLRFTLSRPVAAAVSPSHEEHLWWACDAADRFVPLSAAEEEAIAVAAREVEPIFSRTVVAI